MFSASKSTGRKEWHLQGMTCISRWMKHVLHRQGMALQKGVETWKACLRACLFGEKYYINVYWTHFSASKAEGNWSKQVRSSAKSSKTSVLQLKNAVVFFTAEFCLLSKKTQSWSQKLLAFSSSKDTRTSLSGSLEIRLQLMLGS